MFDASEITTPNQEALPYLPIVPVVETLSWQTRIFKSAVGAEVRTPLLRYPNYEIEYSFIFGFGEKDQLELLSQASETVDWIVPLVYQMALVDNFSSTLRPISSFSTRRSPFYKVFNIVALVNPLCGNIVYKHLSSTVSPSDATLYYLSPFTDAQVDLLKGGDTYLCPCVAAQIEPSISSNQVGLSREGDMLSLRWRWNGEYEGKLHYTDTFSFVSAVQSPLNVTETAPQVDFGDNFTGVNRYKPEAQPFDSGQTIKAEYFLDTSYNRDDYSFRGALLGAHGGSQAKHYVYDDKLHRLAGDSVSITYDQRVATASMSLKEVTA